jgi:hypothetical protein
VEGDLVVRMRCVITGPLGVMRESSSGGEGRGVPCRVRTRVTGEEGRRGGRWVSRVRVGGEGRRERECAKSLARLPRPRMWMWGGGEGGIAWFDGGGVVVVGGVEVEEVRRWGGDLEVWRGEEGI